MKRQEEWTGIGKRPTDWGKPRTCPGCGAVIPFVKKNENGVTGWTRCPLHKAAPELLAALQAMVSAHDVIDGKAGASPEERHRIRDRARAVIAKAGAS